MELQANPTRQKRALNVMTSKDDVEKLLEDAKQRFAEVYGGEITTYAATPKPERKPWKKKPTVMDLAYRQALKEAEEGTEK